MPSSALSRDDSGFAMITVVMGFMVVAMLAFLVMSNSERQVDDSYRVYREDRVLASAEAQLERFAALLTENGLYYNDGVDDAERARKCTLSAIPANIGVVREPGQAWSDLRCTGWIYQDPAAGWYESPLISATTTGERVEIQMEVSPPTGPTPLLVSVVGRNVGGSEIRAVSATMRAESLSEYVRSANGNLSYGTGADVIGKVFANGDLSFAAGVTIHDDAFASGQITAAPVFLDGSVAYVGSYRSGQSPPQYNDFADSSLATFDFNTIWKQTRVVKTAACLGGGLCLDFPAASTYMIEPVVNGSGGALRVWRNNSSVNPGSCSSPYGHTGHTSGGWTEMTGSPFAIPSNGAVWANGDVIVGNRNVGGSTARIEGSFTIYAGDNGDVIPGLPTSGQQIIVVNKSLMVDVRDGAMPGGSATAAFIASGEAYLSKAAGNASGNHLTLEASVLTQGGVVNGNTCSSSGTVEFTFRGSLTSQGTNPLSGTFTPRNYGFDPRLEFVRPPFFPLVNDRWWWQDWREIAIPDWAK